MLRPVQAARTLSTAGLTGITLYAPKELIISARAGTPLPEIEAALAAHGQHLIAEPPDLSALLGSDGEAANPGRHGRDQPVRPAPRRLGRDARPRHGHPRGDRRGEMIHSGGRVLKNVTGLDLCKLLTGSHGTLGVITEITLKVLPAPEATGTLVLPGLDADAGGRRAVRGAGLAVRRLRRRLAAGGRCRARARAAGAPGSATLIRIEDFRRRSPTASAGCSDHRGRPAR